MLWAFQKNNQARNYQALGPSDIEQLPSNLNEQAHLDVYKPRDSSLFTKLLIIWVILLAIWGGLDLVWRALGFAYVNWSTGQQGDICDMCGNGPEEARILGCSFNILRGACTLVQMDRGRTGSIKKAFNRLKLLASLSFGEQVFGQRINGTLPIVSIRGGRSGVQQLERKRVWTVVLTKGTSYIVAASLTKACQKTGL
ncbi:hypothetical protein FKW77_010570 [Venturia effusa]|uniref:Uncharacterized protein n=1 Tax=Venturia effusa TaxID=50376 RepID=A0A517KXV1_9PEZI|nr:hypothetical protein FKW77_010570 [Venturia effusa]